MIIDILEQIEVRAGASRAEARRAAEMVVVAGHAVEWPLGSDPEPDPATIAPAIEDVAGEIGWEREGA